MAARPKIPQSTVDRLMAKCGHTCCLCRRELAHDIHHLNFNPTDNNEDNLIPLCKNCHVKVGCVAHPVCKRAPRTSKHALPRKFTERELKMIRDRWYELYDSFPRADMLPEHEDLKPKTLLKKNKAKKK